PVPPPPPTPLSPYPTLFRSLERAATNSGTGRRARAREHAARSSLHSRRDDAGHEESLESEEDDEDGENGDDGAGRDLGPQRPVVDRKSTRLNSSHQIISYAV